MLRGVSTLFTSFPNDAPEEIPHSQSSFGMTFGTGSVTPSNYVARSLHATNFIL